LGLIGVAGYYAFFPSYGLHLDNQLEAQKTASSRQCASSAPVASAPPSISLFAVVPLGGGNFFSPSAPRSAADMGCKV